MTELAGFPELTPYGGGWCGNDVFTARCSPSDTRELARALHQQMGERLRQGGLSRLLRARLPGRRRHRRDVPGRAQPAGHRRQLDDERHRRRLRRHAAVPVPPARVHGRRLRDRRRRAERAVGASAARSTRGASSSSRRPTSTVELITRAPQLGDLADRREPTAAIRFVRRDTDWHTVADEDEAFYLRIAAAGNYRYPGADLGILVTRGDLMDDDHELTDRAHRWITGHQGRVPRRAGHAGEMPCPRRSPSRSRCSDDVRSTFTVRGRRRSWRRAPRWQALFERHVARATGAWFLHEGEAARAALRGVAADAARAHAGAGADLGAPGRAGRRRRRGGAHALDVAAAVVPVRLLAGRAGRRATRCSRATTTTRPSRLEGAIVSTGWAGRRVIGMSDCLWGLLDGDQRGRAGDLAGVRRPAGGRRRLRRPAGHALPAADLLDGRRGAARPRPASAPARAHADAGRPRRASPDRLPGARPRGAVPPPGGGDQPPGRGRVDRARGARRGRSSASAGSSALLDDDPAQAGESFAGAFLAAAALLDGLLQGIRHALHGGLPAARGRGRVPLARHVWLHSFDRFERARTPRRSSRPRSPS